MAILIMNIAKTEHKGRGAQHNPHNRFQRLKYEAEDAYREYCALEGEPETSARTRYIDIHPKTILTRNNSPDVPFNYSINPYQGCEHGCTYCYARNSHEFWGYSAGLDFEKVILVKHQAPKLLEQHFRSGKWQPEMICLSGNTDCYQPAERRFGITRQLLEVFWKYRHPVGIITKNSLVLRDLDLLREMARLRLIRVVVSITTLREELRRTMEPRTASVQQRLKTVELLAEAGVPVSVNMAPIIPGLNSDEIPALVEAVAKRGAQRVNYIAVRLNGQIADIFDQWVHQAFPERADKVLALVKQIHGGQLNDSRFGARMRGEGAYMEGVRQLFQAAVSKHLPEHSIVPLDYSLFEQKINPQLSLF